MIFLDDMCVRDVHQSNQSGYCCWCLLVERIVDFAVVAVALEDYRCPVFYLHGFVLFSWTLELPNLLVQLFTIYHNLKPGDIHFHNSDNFVRLAVYFYFPNYFPDFFHRHFPGCRRLHRYFPLDEFP